MSEAPQPGNRKQVQWIMFGAFCVTHLVFAGVGVFLHGNAPPQPEQVQVLAPALAVVALGELGVLFGVMPKVLGKGSYDVFFIVRAAFAESISIYGLVLAVIGAPLEWCAGFWGVGLSTLLVLAPTDKDQAAFERRRSS